MLQRPSEGPARVQEACRTGSLRWKDSFIHLLLGFPRSSNSGQGGHPHSPDLWDLGTESKPRSRMGEKQEWPLPMLLTPEQPLVNACQPTVQCCPRGWQPWVGWVLSLSQPVLPFPPRRNLCLAWRKALLSSAAPRPEHLELLYRVCGLWFPLS